MSTAQLTELLLEWYSRQGRKLPWRNSAPDCQPPSPYRVWVSEIMLQQTRVETVIPYYERWMERFPTLAALAEATQQDVLAAWEGLGYYSRARNLQRAAQVVMTEYGGELPADLPALRKLPGIGRSTAGAIASIAFGRDEPILDGNVRRVLARLFAVGEPPGSAQGERRLWELAAECLPPGRACDYNQALMDLGATVCTPHVPQCATCPLVEFCEAHRRGIEEMLPARLEKPPIPHYTVTAAVITHQGKVLIAQRPPNGLLGGLWEFPGGKLLAGEELASCLQREICEELDVEIIVGALLGIYQHTYTHFRVTLHAFQCELRNGDEPQPLQVSDLRWVTPAETAAFPMGKIDRQISRDLLSMTIA